MVHDVLHNPLEPPFPEGLERAIFGMGCFWGAERMFWQAPGVWTTAVGYAGGYTPKPSYEQVCTGRTGHAEVVLVVFDPNATSYDEMLRIFWEGHDPTQGKRQGNDVGTQYRSAIYWTTEAQRDAARGVEGDVPGAPDGGGLRRRSPRRSRRPASSSTPSPTTSSTSTRCPTATAAWAERASAARSEWGRAQVPAEPGVSKGQTPFRTQEHQPDAQVPRRAGRPSRRTGLDRGPGSRRSTRQASPREADARGVRPRGRHRRLQGADVRLRHRPHRRLGPQRLGPRRPRRRQRPQARRLARLRLARGRPDLGHGRPAPRSSAAAGAPARARRLGVSIRLVDVAPPKSDGTPQLDEREVPRQRATSSASSRPASTSRTTSTTARPTSSSPAPSSSPR